MQKIMFNDHYGLTQAVLDGRKTMTRRIVPNGTPLGNWEDTENKSRYKTGEVVAIAQAYKDALNPLDWVNKLIYEDEKSWSNKMFVKSELMPHQIRITDIHIERLQDISDEDCLREGIIDKLLCPPGDITYYYVPGMPTRSKNDVYPTPQEAFAVLIDKVSGKGTWERNPLVFVYEFDLIK